MMASSSSSSNLSDHLLQDEFPAWPSSCLPSAPAPHSANHQWSQPLMLNSADELEVLLSSQGHHHSHQAAASPVIPPQLSSLLMMQDLGFQWSNCGSADSAAMLLMSGQQQDDGQNKIKEDQRRESLDSRSSCAAAAGTAAIAYHDIVVGGGAGLPAVAAGDLDGGSVLPSINMSRPVLQKLCPAPPLPLPGDAFEILASSRLCKTLLLGQASSVLLHNGMAPLLRSEHVPYGPPPPEAVVHPQAAGPCIGNYKMGVPSVVNGGMGGSRHWSLQNNAACHQKTAAAASSSPAPSPKKARLESRSSVVPSFKVRKEKLGDRIAALQQLVSPFGKTDTASVLMEAIGYIKFLQDQVETLSGPYLRSSRTKKLKTGQRGFPNANGEEETRPGLRSRGLCLVPLSCTSYVTNENGVWAPPNFSGN